MKEIKSGIIIHCNTPNEANELLQFLKTQGYTWHGWCLMPEENSWDYYKSNTGYLLWNHKILCSMRDYLRWKMDNVCSAECMEFSEFKSKYMEKENPIVKTKPDGTYKEALELCKQILATLQKECDKYNTEKANGAYNAYQQCISLFDELTKNPEEFTRRYQHVLEISSIEPGDIVEIGEGKTRVLITEMYKNRAPKCCIGVGLNLDSNFAPVSISDDVTLKKIGHANLQEVLQTMIQENENQDEAEFERE